MPDETFGAGYVIREIKATVDAIEHKLDGFAGKAEVAFLATRMDSMVPRSEHDVHWKRDDERFERIDDRLEKIEGQLDNIIGDRLPRWVLPVLAIVAPIVVALLAHFWR